MVEYLGPQDEMFQYRSKYVRHGDKIHVTEPDDVRTQHSQLAANDGIRGEIERLRQLDPAELDAGTIMVITAGVLKLIRIIGFSSTLELPHPHLTHTARNRTIEVFRRLSPGYDIEDSG